MSGFRFLDRGEVQLKGLTDPAPVVQIAREGSIPQDVTKFTVRAAPRDNLPLQTTPFIGREREVKSIAELLKQQDVRLLTLTGPGGTGKTRLSLRVAMDLIDTFADGIFFVSLARSAIRMSSAPQLPRRSASQRDLNVLLTRI
jgi:hypothetical protein